MYKKRPAHLSIVERLNGSGDRLLLRGPDVERVQGTFLSSDECRAIKVNE